MTPTTPSIATPRRRFWLEPVAGVVAFLFAATVGRDVFEETIGNFAIGPKGKIVCGIVAAVATVVLLYLRRFRARPVGRAGLAALTLVVCLVPAWLFSDRLSTYWIYGDDWEYVASSRTFSRLVENLFTPHNVHVVPVWRVVSWLTVAGGTGLVDLPGRMAATAYACLAATMLLAGRFVARETRSTTIGLATAAVVGTTAVMQSAGAWFSAAQALGAAIGVLVMLSYLQIWRRRGGVLALIPAFLGVVLAGWSWTVGYAAGPVGAAYLLADGRRRCLWAALGLFLFAGAVGGTTLKVAGRAIQEQSTISFHGRKTTDAISLPSAFYHTIQAVPERLLMGNLGVVAETTIQQAAAVLAVIGVVWRASRRNKGWLTPLEAAGLALMASSYALEWMFRGYLPFESLRGFVPWYDTIPHVGLALFVGGWWAAARSGSSTNRPFTWGSALGVLALQATLATLSLPLNEAYFLKEVRAMVPAEVAKFPVPRLKRVWAVYVAFDRAERQRRMLTRIDRAETVMRSRGLGRDSVRAGLGRSVWPDPPVIDDADLLALPKEGRAAGAPAAIRTYFGPAFALEPEPRPTWVPVNAPWVPKNSQ